MEAILETKNLCKNFGGLTALNNLGIAIEEGEIRGLIGPNGSGKTTFFNVITGYYKATSGNIRFGGRDIEKMTPDEIAKLGVVRTFQSTTVFHEMTLLQNVYIGFHLQVRSGFFSSLFRTPSNIIEERDIAKRSAELLKYIGIYTQNDGLARNLPHGLQRRLGVAIALAAKPKLLLLDEPVTGMNLTEAKNMMDHIKKIRDQMGITIILVEHNMRVVLGVCDKITVLNYGQKIFEGYPREVVKNKEVIEAYLGADKSREDVF